MLLPSIVFPLFRPFSSPLSSLLIQSPHSSSSIRIFILPFQSRSDVHNFISFFVAGAVAVVIVVVIHSSFIQFGLAKDFAIWQVSHGQKRILRLWFVFVSHTSPHPFNVVSNRSIWTKNCFGSAATNTFGLNALMYACLCKCVYMWTLFIWLKDSMHEKQVLELVRCAGVFTLPQYPLR